MARGVEVVAPDGRTWRIRRRWVPRLGEESIPGRMWRRIRSTGRSAGRKVRDGADADPGCLDALDEGIVVVLAVLAGLLLLVFVVIPVLTAVVDILVLLLITAVSLLARALGWHPWVVHALADDGSLLEWRITGWRASGELVDRVAGSLRSGLPVPPVGMVDRGAI